MSQTVGYRYLGYVRAQFPNALSLIDYLRHTLLGCCPPKRTSKSCNFQGATLNVEEFKFLEYLK